MKRKSNVFKIVVVLVLFVFLGVGVYLLITNSSKLEGGSDLLSVSTFYVSVNNGNKIKDHSDGFSLTFNQPLDVAVSFPFEKIDPASSGYSVKIVPSGKVNFEFLVGSSVHTLSSESDLTSAFDVDLQDDSFSVSTDKCFQEIFEDIYPGESVFVDLSTFTAPNRDMFRIVVTSGDGSVITIDFAYAILPESISLNSEVIVF